MKDKSRTHPRYAAVLLGLVLSLLAVGVALAAGNISNTDKWAWGTNVGWINFAPSNGGVTVSPAGVFSGDAWGENIGWIRFSGTADDSTTYKVATAGPLAVTLAGLDAQQVDGHVLVAWETVSEIDTAGFNLYRSDDPAGPLTLLAHVPSQAPGSTQGAAYSYEDLNVSPGEIYWYWLEDVSLSGATTLHGPVSLTVQTPTAVTLAGFDAAAGSMPSFAGLALAAGLAAAGGLIWRRRRQEAVKS